MIPQYIKQLQYYKRALVSWNGANSPKNETYIYRLITGKHYQKTLTRDCTCFQ